MKCVPDVKIIWNHIKLYGILMVILVAIIVDVSLNLIGLVMGLFFRIIIVSTLYLQEKRKTLYMVIQNQENLRMNNVYLNVLHCYLNVNKGIVIFGKCLDHFPILFQACQMNLKKQFGFRQRDKGNSSTNSSNLRENIRLKRFSEL